MDYFLEKDPGIWGIVRMNFGQGVRCFWLIRMSLKIPEIRVF